MLTSPANVMVVTNYIPPTSSIYTCNGTTDSLARTGENSLKGREIYELSCLVAGEGSCVYVYVSILKNSVSALHGTFFALY